MLIIKQIKSMLKWLGLINTTLYDGDNWVSGTPKTIANIDKYSILQARIYSYVRPIILIRQDDNTFYGSIDMNVNSDGGFTTFAIVLAKTNGNWYVSPYSMVNNANSTNGAVFSNYGINKIVGLIPKWGGVL